MAPRTANNGEPLEFLFNYNFWKNENDMRRAFGYDSKGGPLKLKEKDPGLARELEFSMLFVFVKFCSKSAIY